MYLNNQNPQTPPNSFTASINQAKLIFNSCSIFDFGFADLGISQADIFLAIIK